jgi:hypothetical protein
MNLLLKVFWTGVHLAFSLVAIAAHLPSRRRCVMVFTHWQDVDEEGLDRQMGPLVDALKARERLVEITLVPLSRALFQNLALKRRLFISYAAILGPARLFCPAVRDRERLMAVRARIAGLFLRLLRPRTIWLVDESGSGQPMVRAAQKLGIRTVGVQHGSFGGGNRQYEPVQGEVLRVVPVDLLCAWSEWFLAELLSISPIYTRENTKVTGRLRYPAPPEPARHGDRIRVFVIGDAQPVSDELIRPFVEALSSNAAFEVAIRLHPARAKAQGVAQPSLPQALVWCDVVLGRRSSALLEALWFHRPVILVGEPDPEMGRLIREGLAIACLEASDVADSCRRVMTAAHVKKLRTARVLVWGAAPLDPVGAVYDAGDNTL